MIVLKVTINDREMAFSSSKTYGPYPQNKDITISASGNESEKHLQHRRRRLKPKRFKIQYRDNFEF